MTLQEILDAIAAIEQDGGYGDFTNNGYIHIRELQRAFFFAPFVQLMAPGWQTRANSLSSLATNLKNFLYSAGVVNSDNYNALAAEKTCAISPDIPGYGGQLIVTVETAIGTLII